jgi:hypothetical protein
MWLAAHSAESRLSASEGVLGRFASILSKSPSHALQLTFHLEREVQDRMASSQKALDSHLGQAGLVTAQRVALESNKMKELSPFVQLSRDHVAGEKELLKRKAELLNVGSSS